MDNYIMNQRKRCGFSLPERIVYAIRDFLFPGKSREAWRKHAGEMQNELNQHNWDKYAFYITNHQLCRDTTRGQGL